jgi:FlaA1/EpsC-like NDP-sugar epimerase
MNYSKRFIRDVSALFKEHQIFKDQITDFDQFKKKRIAIIGGAGSVGTALALFLIKIDVKKIIVIDNNEYSIFKLTKKIEEKYQSKIVIKFLSILNFKELEKNFKHYKFDYIYNCAAIKHVDIAESNKQEAYRVNVEGNENLLKLSKKYNTKKFIFISTDKAIDPISVMGKTKHIAENKIINFKCDFEKKILRFPNIILSSGSLLEAIYDCFKNKKIFQLRGSNLTRYFIFSKDAVHFIILATLKKNFYKIITLKNVKKMRILKIIKFFNKYYKLDFKITKKNKYEKVDEVYYGKKTDYI